MKELLNKYNKECAIKSNCANIVLKLGIIINIIIYIINYIVLKKIYCFLLFLIIMVTLFILSQSIFAIETGKKLGIYNGDISFKYVKETYRKIDEFQKKWIINYCKKNKINTVSKVNILIKEINNKKEENNIKYIDPLIIGTLFLKIWELVLQDLTNNIGFWNMLPIAVFFIIGISVISGWISREIIEDRKTFNQFDEYSGNQRLEELLVEVALKCKK